MTQSDDWTTAEQAVTDGAQTLRAARTHREIRAWAAEAGVATKALSSARSSGRCTRISEPVGDTGTNSETRDCVKTVGWTAKERPGVLEKVSDYRGLSTYEGPQRRVWVPVNRSVSAASAETRIPTASNVPRAAPNR